MRKDAGNTQRQVAMVPTGGALPRGQKGGWSLSVREGLQVAAGAREWVCRRIRRLHPLLHLFR